MNEQMSDFEERQRMADEFIERLQPYAQRRPLEFDLRGYATFLKERGIAGKDVPPDVAEKFAK